MSIGSALGALGGGDALEILVAMRDLTGAGFAKVRSEITATEARANSTNFSGFSRASKSAEQDAENLAGKAGGGGIAGLASNLGGLVVPAGLAIAAVASYGFEAAKAYQAHEVAVGKLTTSLNENVPAWQSQKQAITDTTDAAVKLGFTDTETTNAMAGLVAATHDVGEATQILATAEDLARFSGISLQDATDALTKVEAGSYKMLKSLGIELAKGATQTEALAAVQKVAGGQAQSYANSDLGAVAVASAKVDAANEKIGAGFSKLEAVVLPALGDAVQAVGDDFDFFGKAMDKTVPSGEKLDSMLQVLNDIGGKNLPIIGGMVGDLQKVSDAQHEAAAEAATHGDEIIGLRSQVVGLGNDESGTLATQMDFATVLGLTSKAASDAKKEIPQLASAIDDQLFGKAINAGHIQELKDSNAQLEKQRDHVKKNGPEWTILTGQIAANNKALFDLQLQMAETKGPNAVLSFLDQWKKKNGDAGGAVQGLIDKEKTLLALLIKMGPQTGGATYTGIGGSINVPQFASGGVVDPRPGGTIINVGEAGEREYVIPESKMGGVGGGVTTVHTHIYLDGQQIAETVDRYRYRSDALAPTSTRGF